MSTSMKLSSSPGVREVNGCKMSDTKGVQNRDFSPFERALFGIPESKSLGLDVELRDEYIFERSHQS